ncbi:hypothetical protein [Martelella mediterranea]|nr:hypothetical protein [Martelella mediterranea]
MFELHRETLNDKTIRIIPDPDPMNLRVECDTLGTIRSRICERAWTVQKQRGRALMRF